MTGVPGSTTRSSNGTPGGETPSERSPQWMARPPPPLGTQLARYEAAAYLAHIGATGLCQNYSPGRRLGTLFPKRPRQKVIVKGKK